MKEVQDIDELEALLGGLSDDELNELGSLDEPSPAAKPAKSAEDLDAELEGLLDEPAAAPVAVKPRRPKPKLPPVEAEEEPKKAAVVDEAANEALADKVVILLNGLAEEFGFGEDTQAMYNIIAPILAGLTNESVFEEVEVELRKALKENAEPFEAEQPKADPQELPDELLSALDEVPDEEIAKTVQIVQEADKIIEKAQAVEITGSDDAELAALLEAVEAPDVAAIPPAPVTPAVKTRPTPTKAVGALKTFIDANKLQEDLSFTETNLSLAMTRQAALFAHYARLSADATYQSDRAKQQVELLEAQLNQRFRDSMVASGTKFTEKAIDAMVIQDSSYQEAQERAHEARAIASMVATAADSFRHRKDMLIQVGADQRLEKQGELRMKEHPGQRAMDNMGDK